MKQWRLMNWPEMRKRLRAIITGRTRGYFLTVRVQAFSNDHRLPVRYIYACYAGWSQISYRCKHACANASYKPVTKRGSKPQFFFQGLQSGTEGACKYSHPIVVPAKYQEECNTWMHATPLLFMRLRSYFLSLK